MITTVNRKFLLDANVFIEAKRRYYSFDICSGFWDCLLWQQQGDRIRSIDRVKHELESGGDDLGNWATSIMPATGFASTNDAPVIDNFGRMVTWVQGQPQFNPEAKAEFAAKPDGWLIAYAKTYNLILVTHEIFAPDARKKVPIPNVCKEFSVDYTDTFEMLRGLGAEFHWEHPSQV